LSKERQKGIEQMLSALQKSYDTMLENLKSMDGEDKKVDITKAVDDECELNHLRDALRDEEFARIEEGNGPYASSTLYLDVIAELERMGDYLINISQAVERACVECG